MDRLVIVSNRLPVSLGVDKRGQWQVQPSSGGLITALGPVVKQRKGLWVGWPGTLAQPPLNTVIKSASKDLGYTLESVWLTEEEIEQYYYGFSNEIMWPLFHDLQTRCNFDPAYWNAYQSVNHKFAEAIVKKTSAASDYVWIQDYHLMLVARELRQQGVQGKVGFFLHIPFPSPDIYMKLPWRKQILEALLDYDLLGFQTLHDRNNFARCIEITFKGYRIDARKQLATISTPDREVAIGSFPISIDFKEFAREASSSVVTHRSKRLRDAIPNRQIIIGVDRLDYSKGIPERLLCFRNALQRFPELKGKITFVQIVVPSREDIPEYQTLRREIEGLVSEINGTYTQSGWIPIHYMFRSLNRTELLAYYRAADIALVTPVKDGMNLVSKEYCASNVDERGVLILSEFAGSARQLGQNSLLVNPYDIEGVANAIKRAYDMSSLERSQRMRRLRRSIAKRDIYWWVGSFLHSAPDGG